MKVDSFNYLLLILLLTSNVLIELLSSGITCFLFHVPHANWKKSWQGSCVWSIAASNDEAKS